MIDKETWKIGTHHDKMEELIQYSMHAQYHKSVFLKKKTLSSNVKQFTVFLWIALMGNSHGFGKWCTTSSNKAWLTSCNELWPDYQKHVNQIILNCTILQILIYVFNWLYFTQCLTYFSSIDHLSCLCA